MKYRFLPLILILALLFSLPIAASANTSAEKTPADAILAYELEDAGCSSVQEWISDFLASKAGGEWYAMALAQSGEDYDFSAYASALQTSAEASDGAKATEYQKNALTLMACGFSSEYAEEAADLTIGQQGIMSLIYGLHLLNNGAVSSCTAADTANELTSLQLADGGWALSGETADPDVTAMAILALAPYYKTNADIGSCIDRALERLSTLQRDDGCYASYGNENPESCAQVILALCALDIDPAADTRFVKNGCSVVDAMLSYQLEDGSFCHTSGGESNATATRQAFMALTAQQRLQDGKGSFYLFDHDTQPLTDTAVSGSTSVQKGWHSDIKLLLTCCIAGAAVLVCILLLILKKRSWKNYVFVVCIALVLIAGVHFISISSAESYYSAPALSGSTITTEITIRCDTIAGEDSNIPADGCVLDTCTIEVNEGATAYDQLIAAAKTYSLLLDKSSDNYIRAINNISELDYGSLSGWMYCVNGSFADVGCSEYVLHDGDCVEWLYTRNIGKDITSSYTEAEP